MSGRRMQVASDAGASVCAKPGCGAAGIRSGIRAGTSPGCRARLAAVRADTVSH